MNYARFPFEKISKDSRVVLYGAGRVGRAMFEQNRERKHCEIVGIVDRDRNKKAEWGGRMETIAPDCLPELQFDSILLSVGDENFGSVYRRLADEGAFQDKLVPIDLGERPGLGSDVLLDDAFHWFIADHRNWDKTVGDYRSCWAGRNIRGNWISCGAPAVALLLRGYRYENAVFHVIDGSGGYIGSISVEAIRGLSSLPVGSIGDWTVADILGELNRNRINTDFSVNMGHRILDLYGPVLKLGELAVLDNGKVSHLIRRIDFEAMFCKPAERDGLYIASRSRHKGKSPFQEYRYNVYSQSGEDGVIARIFQTIGFQSHYAVEFGAWDGVHLSNIRNLILEHGMNALFIEGDPDRAEEGMRNYRDFPKVAFVAEYIGINKYRKLEDILHSCNAPQDIDVLSIDIDGWDYWIWDSLKNYRPRVVIIEFNQAIDRDWVVISPSDEKIRTGSSARALVELGIRKGYELLDMVGCNLVFCTREEFLKFGDYDNSLEALWPCAGAQSLFSTYNGDVYGDPWGRAGKGALEPLD